MFPTQLDVQVRHEQYKDLIRESTLERLVQNTWTILASRRGRVDRPIERHDPGRPHLWCQPFHADRVCAYM
jgi:hypothetical protein